MRLHLKDDFEAAHLSLLAIVLVLIGLGCSIYYFGHSYQTQAEVSRVARAVSGF